MEEKAPTPPASPERPAKDKKEKRATPNFDVSKLREKLQEVKSLQEKSYFSEKKVQEGLTYLIDQEELLRKKIESTSASPEKKNATPKEEGSDVSKPRPPSPTAPASPATGTKPKLFDLRFF